jgi:hypothetical protein
MPRSGAQVEVRLGDDVRRPAAEGRDIYAVTAPLVVEAVGQIPRDAKARGVFSPGELFDAADFLTALAPDISTSA